MAFQTTQDNKNSAFEEWKAQYGANFDSKEESYRRIIFEKNLANVEKHNADASQTYKIGINQFSIYTEEEFASRFLMSTPPILGQMNVDEKMTEPSNDVDWVSQGKVSPIKNQGQCGSCWAFSATGVMESWAKFKGQNVNLSEQQLVDCSRPQGNQGCNGGWPSSALKYVQANGITTESAYAYVARDQSCKTQGGSFKISGYNSYSACNGLQSSINNSPVSVTVDASKWSSYRSGVFSNCGTSINHAVLLVGVISGNWKIKNSWGTGWGESGYIRLGSGNTCGVCAYAGVVPK